MTRPYTFYSLILIFFSTVAHLSAQTNVRSVQDFDQQWKFFLGDDPKASASKYPDGKWRVLNLPHDWGVEGAFSKSNPATFGGGALPGGTG
ncbi:hypothetical protein [Pedobacter sp. L105]|uniref:hypothetical protein n=1 Tax=Pedobacter sp. L105 TaxID=1641871 RepID=UPI00131BCB68|nr:hypothetical protein [Pedobacter sp. L105]